MKHIVLIDGHHMMYRAYWAIPRTMKTSEQEQINTVFGMASMLLAILQQEEPDALLFCFDEGDQTFRHQEADEYKAGRAETPDDFYAQIPRVFELLSIWNVPVVSDPQYEADDFLGAYALRAKEAGYRVTVVSGDKDILQLAQENIRVAVPHKGYQAVEYLGPSEVEAKLGITPAQVPAFKGLSGDSSDNLPGVRGIGPKTAAELLQQYGTLESIYEHLPDIRSSVAGKLEADKDQAFFCERMATLETNIELPVPLEELSCCDQPTKAVLNFFQLLEFTLLTRRLQRLLTTDYGRRTFTDAETMAATEISTKKDESQLSLFS